jgi:hypothetical protein
MTQEIPVACFLTDKELQRRRSDHLNKIAASLVDFTELENGFSYRFPLRATMLQDLIEVIELERKCCPFLDFKLIMKAGSDFVSLELTGADGTKEMIRSLFEWN